MRKIRLVMIALSLVTVLGCNPQITTPTATFLPASVIPTESPEPTSTSIPTSPPSATTIPTSSSKIPLPSSGQLYHGVYPGGVTGEEDDLTIKDLRSYEETVGKTAVWVYFSNNWYRDRKFPLDTATWIRDAGSIPYVRLMLRSSPEQDQPEPTFSLQNILDGKFDGDFQKWCAGARDFGTPILAEYGTEVNGSWFSWNGFWNGAGQADGYGDPSQPDGPERFRDAYRHIIQICREESATNITWVFHVNNGDYPEDAWNALENYYPGDEWIDWLAISVYGAQTPQDDYWDEFRPGMDDAYARVEKLSPTKPIILAEFGVTKGNPLGDQAQWARDALSDITSLRYPRLIGFSWWNEWWENGEGEADTTMRVQDNPDLADVFQELVGKNPVIAGKVTP